MHPLTPPVHKIPPCSFSTKPVLSPKLLKLGQLGRSWADQRYSVPGFPVSQLLPSPHLMLPFQLGSISSRCSGNGPAPLSPPSSRRCSRGGSDERSDARAAKIEPTFQHFNVFFIFFFRLDPQASISGVMLEVMNTE